MDGVTGITLILILSFAIERVVAALIFLLSLWPWFRTQMTKYIRLWRFVLAGGLAIGAISITKPEIGILTELGIAITDPKCLDQFVTAIVLVGGADHVASFQESIAAGKVEEPQQPIQVTGTLTLDKDALGVVSPND